MNNLFRTDPLPEASSQEFRRTGIIFLLSALLHAVLVAGALFAQLFTPPPEDHFSNISLTFEEPQLTPPPEKPPLPTFRPPRPPAPPATILPRASQVPPASQPAVPLLGWNSKQGPEGRTVRPPGEDGKIHGPPPPGGGGDSKPLGESEKEARSIPENNPPDGAPGETREIARRTEEPAPPAAGDDLLFRRREQLPSGGGGSGHTAQNSRRSSGGTGPSGPGRGLNTGTSGYGSAFGDLVFDSNDYRWGEYSSKVYWEVYRSWLRELYGRVRRFERDQQMRNLPNLDGRVAIHFFIVRDGSVQNLDVVSPSVVPTLDEASAAALRRAVLPPLPEDFPRDQEGVTFTFSIQGFEAAAQLERQLREAQWAGEF